MKKISYIVAAACMVFASCELERMPHTGYTTDQMDESPTAVTEMLTGVYGQLKGMVDATHRTGEYPGDTFAKNQSTTDDFSDYMTFNHRVRNNSRTKIIWDNCYKIIAQTSEIMNRIDEASATDARRHQLGEAYYLRGMSYFFLVRIFGMPYYQSPESHMGVPIINGTPENILDPGLALVDRSTVKEVYETQIIPDLKKAEELMAASKVTKTNIFASAYAAQALMSRVYLYMSGTYANPDTRYADLAIEYANKVIDSKKYTILSRDDFKKYNVTTPENNKETIFAVKRTDTDIRTSPGHSNTFGGMYSNAGGAGWNEVYASEKYLDRLRHSGNDNKNVFGANAADARGSFIRPYYRGQVAADTEAGLIPTTGGDVFRVVVDNYAADGKLSNFSYKQLPVSGTPGALVATETVKVGTEEKKNSYPLTEVDGRYKFTYTPANGPGAVEYIGDIDKEISTSGALQLPMISIFKCSLEGGVQQTHSPVVSRLAEMYLNLAEAYVKKGDYAKALAAVNVVRDRAVIGNSITLEQITEHGPAVVDNERTLELAYEAHRGFDAFRVGFPMEHRYPAWLNATNGINHNLISIPADHDRVIQIFENATLNAYVNYGGLTQNPNGPLPAPTYEPYTPFIPY
jgi:hypothetical protein